MWCLDTLFVSGFDLTLLYVVPGYSFCIWIRSNCSLCGTNLDELQVNLRDLRVGHGAQAEHLPE